MGFPSAILATRDMSDDSLSPLTYDLLFTLLVLALVSLISATTLFFIRRRRNAAKGAGLPMYNTATLAAARPHHRRTPSSLTAPVATTQYPYQPTFVGHEKNEMGSSAPPSPQTHPLPEIRIHFPEETDQSGNRQSRVVSVHIGDNGVGLGPVEEQLPPYQKDATDRFQSIDLQRIGGLKEKETAS